MGTGASSSLTRDARWSEADAARHPLLDAGPGALHVDGGALEQRLHAGQARLERSQALIQGLLLHPRPPSWLRRAAVAADASPLRADRRRRRAARSPRRTGDPRAASRWAARLR